MFWDVASRIARSQPQSRDVLEVTARSIAGQKRLVNTAWFDRYSWLTLCETRNVLLCHCCVEAHCLCLITFSKKGEEAFVTAGFCHWKNALERFARHEASNTHMEAVMNVRSVATVNIAGVLNTKRKEQQLQRQHALIKDLSSVRYLVRQGLAVRGHDEKEGNMMQLLHMWSAHNADIRVWMREGNYLSHEIVNEIKLMADNVLR